MRRQRLALHPLKIYITGDVDTVISCGYSAFSLVGFFINFIKVLS